MNDIKSEMDRLYKESRHKTGNMNPLYKRSLELSMEGGGKKRRRKKQSKRRSKKRRSSKKRSKRSSKKY